MAAMMFFVFVEAESSDGEVLSTPKRPSPTCHTVSLTASPTTSSESVLLDALPRSMSPIDDPLDAFSLAGRSSATIRRVRKPMPTPSRGGARRVARLTARQSKLVTGTRPTRPPLGPFVGELDLFGWVSNLAANIVGWRVLLKAKTEAKRL